MEQQEMVEHTAIPMNEIDIVSVIEKKPSIFMGREILTGRKMSPLRGIIYGDNGIGKTTFASSGLKPFILDMEGNCGHIDAPSFRISDLESFNDALNELIKNEYDYKTLAIDSLDSLQVLLGDSISKRYTPQELGFGRSNGIWAKEIKNITTKLEYLNEFKGMNVIFTAHWKVKTANNPMTEQYDRYDLRINEEMRTGFCNWVQFIVLATKDVIMDGKEGGFGKKQAKNIERRVLHTRGTPAYYGKNVYDLPPTIPMDWDSFISNVKKFYNN